MNTPNPSEPSARRRHAGQNSRAARAGLVLAVVAVCAAVGAGTWVLGSGADAARQEVPPPSVLTGVTTSAPPLSIAPPPEREPERANRSSSGRTAKKKTSSPDTAR